MSDMPCPRRTTPGDGRVTRQGTSLLYIAGEKTKASAPWGTRKPVQAFVQAFRYAVKPFYLDDCPMVIRSENGIPHRYHETIASRT